MSIGGPNGRKAGKDGTKDQPDRFRPRLRCLSTSGTIQESSILRESNSIRYTTSNIVTNHGNRLFSSTISGMGKKVQNMITVKDMAMVTIDEK